MHWTLTPKANVRFIVLWAVAGSLASLSLSADWRLKFAFGGALLGAIGGGLQLIAMRKSAAALIEARDALAVRKALASSRWGKSYLAAFWTSQVAIIGMAMVTQGALMPLAALVGYCGFSFARDAITLTGSRELARLQAPTGSAPPRASAPAP